MKSILDPSFRYVASDKTDLKKTFRRIRKQLDARAAGPVAPREMPPRDLQATPVHLTLAKRNAA